MSRKMSTSALIYAATISMPATAGARPEDELTRSRAWVNKDGKFANPWPSWNDQTPYKIGMGLIKRKFAGKANSPDTTPPTVPVRKPEFLSDRSHTNDKIRATWLGHACYYVEFPSGLRVLFDPVFEDRCSPFSFMGPKRYTESPCQIKDIPIIDAVIISHAHYDHLSYPTVVEISNSHPEAHFFVPLGNKKWFKDCGITQCTELDWWDEVDFTLSPKSSDGKRASISTTGSAQPQEDGITSRISCLPCQHTANRGLTDRGATLWASWAVTTKSPTGSEKKLWFGGDTGYRAVPEEADGKDDWSEEYAHLPQCPAFKDIGKYRGPFDLGLIPIGAYSPRWVMSPMHANPRDSVEIFRHTKCERALGIHWGTWVLTEEDVLEPPRKLKDALKLYSIPEEGVFDVCDIGESREV
ncbi:hypothetical protein LTR66_017059 [Elasticomyces elasticus]|nr:hypothetical protein LTR66_017059 [Elasticomyces elasticus]